LKREQSLISGQYWDHEEVALRFQKYNLISGSGHNDGRPPDWDDHRR